MPAVQEDKMHENALHAYRLMAEEASDIIIVHEPEGSIFYVSRALERVLGRKPEEIQEGNFLKLIHPDDLDAAHAIRAYPLPGQTLTQTFRVRHADGHYLWLETTTRGVYDQATGRLVNVLSTSHDVTERVQHEMEMKAAQDQAISCNKAKSRFLANMSHELRTPLNAVIGFTDMMRHRMFGPLGNEKYEEYSTLIYDSAQLLLDLISDMLDMAKIEAGKLELNFENVDFNTTIEDSVRMLRDRAQACGLELSVVQPRETLFVNADKRAVKQIMLNLLSNAIKFTPAGGSIAVAVRIRDGFAVISVADTGIGIAAADLERLGQPFEQGNSDPMLAKGGPGLGLALVRALVEKHGGALKIESEEGVGTQVRVSFPITANNRAAA